VTFIPQPPTLPWLSLRHFEVKIIGLVKFGHVLGSYHDSGGNDRTKDEELAAQNYSRTSGNDRTKDEELAAQNYSRTSRRNETATVTTSPQSARTSS